MDFRIDAKHHTPLSYADGVFIIEAQIQDQQEWKHTGRTIRFRLPRIEMWRIRPDKSFVGATITGNDCLSSVLCGVFFNGKWRGHVYYNGEGLKKKTNSPDRILEAVRQEMEQGLSRWNSEGQVLIDH